MPEMMFHITWPDGTQEACYSPSSIIREHLTPGESYELVRFLQLSRTALHAASERVRAKYGFPCTRALGQLTRIERSAFRFADRPEARVTVTRFETGDSP